MRSLIQPKKGRAIAGIDYSQQEFFAAALISNDRNMVTAYASGDVYFDYALRSGIAPSGATRDTHPKERQRAKGAVLGISYLMSKVGLAIDLTNKTGEYVSEDEAQEYIELFDEAYSTYAEWKEDTQEKYASDRFLKLPCGWYMLSENDNHRSFLNFPVQGVSASIMRRAVALAQDAGLDVIYTLHDALYIEYDSFDFDAVDTLKKCMIDAFRYYFDYSKDSELIRVDAETWSKDYSSRSGEKISTKEIDEMILEEVHIDSRSVDEYNRFNKYFKREEYLDIL